MGFRTARLPALTKTMSWCHSSTSAWVTAYIVAAFSVFAGVLVRSLSWLCVAAFIATLISVVLHVVRASLTRKVLPVRIVVGVNVVVLAAAAICRDKVTVQASAAIVASVPLLSYFCFFGWYLALAPPRPGEALRPPMQLREAHWSSQLTVMLVLAVEFVQFNALSFNPKLGTWRDLPSLSDYFSYSFFVFASSSEQFEQQLWGYCALAIGWVLFALITLALISRPRLTERWSDGAAALASELGAAHPHGHLAGQSHATLVSAALAAVEEAVGGEEAPAASASEFTMASPVILVIKTIGRSGIAALRAHARLLLRIRRWACVRLRPDASIRAHPSTQSPPVPLSASVTHHGPRLTRAAPHGSASGARASCVRAAWAASRSSACCPRSSSPSSPPPRSRSPSSSLSSGWCCSGSRCAERSPRSRCSTSPS